MIFFDYLLLVLAAWVVVTGFYMFVKLLLILFSQGSSERTD